MGCHVEPMRRGTPRRPREKDLQHAGCFFPEENKLSLVPLDEEDNFEALAATPARSHRRSPTAGCDQSAPGHVRAGRKLDKMSILSAQLCKIEQKNVSEKTVGLTEARLAVTDAVQTYSNSRYALGRVLHDYKKYSRSSTDG
jgi:hypothetical protein